MEKVQFTEKQIKQTEFWLSSFVELANASFDKNEYKTQEYWKGQVMGICKMADLFKTGIDTKHYLNEMA